jgi:hypothetical protein
MHPLAYRRRNVVRSSKWSFFMTTESGLSVRIYGVRTSGSVVAGDLRCVQSFSSFLYDSPYPVVALASDIARSRDHPRSSTGGQTVTVMF